MTTYLSKISKTELWNSKYNPKTFDDLILHPITKKKLLHFIKYKVDNSIFIGNSGSGKTITSRILARKIIPEEHAKNIFLNLNGSDDRGLNLINNLLIPFIKKKYDEFPIKLILINEAHNITPKAQIQISNLMESYPNCKFIFVSSQLDDISDTIQSRCSILFFPLLSSEQIIEKLKIIVKKEKMDLDDSCLDTICKITQRDLRQAISFLQVIKNVKSDKITPELIYLLFDKPNAEMVHNLIYNIKNKNKSKTFEIINRIKNKGYSPNDILLAIINYILEYKEFEKEEFTKEYLINFYKITSKYYIRINQGTETWLQVFGCLTETFNI